MDWSAFDEEVLSQKSVKAIVDQCESLRDENTRLKEENQRLLQQKLELVNKLREKTENTASFLTLSNKFIDLQSQMTNIYKRDADGIRERLHLTKANENLRKALLKVSEQVESLKNDLTKLEGVEAHAKTLGEELLRTKSQLAAKCKDVDDLYSQLEIMKSSNPHLQSSQSSLMSQIASLQRDKTSMQEMINSLNEKILTLETNASLSGMAAREIRAVQSSQTFSTLSGSAAAVPIATPPEQPKSRVSGLFGSVTSFISKVPQNLRESTSVPLISSPNLSTSTPSTPLSVVFDSSNSVLLSKGSAEGSEGEMLSSISLPRGQCTRFSCHSSSVSSLSFYHGRGPTAPPLLAAACLSGGISFLDVSSTSPRFEIKLSSPDRDAEVLSICSSGNQFVSAASKSLYLWDIENSPNRPLHTLTGHNNVVCAVSFLHNESSSGSVLSGGFAGTHGNISNLVVSCSMDRTVRVWDLRQRQTVRILELPSLPNCLCPSSVTGHVYVGSQDGGVRCFDVLGEGGAGSASPLLYTSKLNSSVSPSSSVQSLCCSRPAAHFLSRQYESKPNIEGGPFVMQGEAVFSLSRDGLVKAWDESLKPILKHKDRFGNESRETSQFFYRSSGSPSGLLPLQISPNGEYLMAGTPNARLNIWNVNSGQLSAELSCNPVNRTSQNQSLGHSQPKRAARPSGATDAFDTDSFFADRLGIIESSSMPSTGAASSPGPSSAVFAVSSLLWSNDMPLVAGDAGGYISVWN